MKFKYIFSFIGLLINQFVNASRSDFYGDNDNRPELFKILDDHVGTIKINLDDEIWSTMKQKTVLPPWNDAIVAEEFETKNATLEFFVKDTDYRVQLEEGQFTFKLGGKGSRSLIKPGYNIKLENGSIYDVKLLRLRPNAGDPTMIREKLSSDMIYKMGIPTTSTNYVNIEVNGEDLGLYVLTNKIKPDFIEKYFDDKDTTNLYECKNDGTRFEDNGIGQNCGNLKEEINDNRDDIQAFNDAINNATSVEDIEKVLDVDQFLHSIAFEFLTVSWDHFLSFSHNYFWYKRKDGKWIILLNDFDETWGLDFNYVLYIFFNTEADRSYIPVQDEINIANIAIRDIDLDHKLLKYLIYDDDTRFRNIIGEIVKKVFNPKVLNSRIDEIADLIRDDVANTRIVDKTTGFPKGCFNTLGRNPKWNMTHFEDCTNYVNWNSNNAYTVSFGLKFFIEERFRYICHTYGINPETLELIEPRPKAAFWGIKNKYKAAYDGKDFFNDPLVRYTYPDLDKEDYMQEEYNADPEKNNKPTNYEYPLHCYEPGYVKPPPMELPGLNFGETEEPNSVNPTPEEPNPESPTPEEKCWSEALGYSCCKTCLVYETDASGEWGYEDHKWCGIPSFCSESKCWSEKLGYPCCSSSCYVYETDESGDWGYEDDHWCGILEEDCQN